MSYYGLKWDLDMTVKFIQLYKSHPCLWDFKSKHYKSKDMREAAYTNIVQEMNLPGLGIQDVKNKIKNLRSTYNQEMRKVEDSMKMESSVIYQSNIKWLGVMEEVLSCVPSVSQVKEHQLDIDQDSLLTPLSKAQDLHSQSNDATPNTSTYSFRPRKRQRDALELIADLESESNINENEERVVVEEKETQFDVFGKSVAMQLKSLSVENALMAQQRIQCILTEIGIADHRDKAANSWTTVKIEQDNDGDANVGSNGDTMIL